MYTVFVPGFLLRARSDPLGVEGVELTDERELLRLLLVCLSSCGTSSHSSSLCECETCDEDLAVQQKKHSRKRSCAAPRCQPTSVNAEFTVSDSVDVCHDVG